MKHNENTRVKIPALVHLTRLGYEYLSLKKYDGGIHEETNIFRSLFSESLARINGKKLSDHDVDVLLSELTVKLSNDDLGRAFYNILLNGINGYRLIDFEDHTRNTYHVVTELTYKNGDDEYLIDEWQDDDTRIKLKPVKNDQNAFGKLFDEDSEHVKDSNVTINYRYFYERIQRQELTMDELFEAIRKLEIISITLARLQISNHFFYGM